MNRLLYTLAVGLVGAALFHVTLLLALPSLAVWAAWRDLASTLPVETPLRPEAAGLPFASGDPLFRTVLCRFDSRNGPLLLTAAGRSAYWSVAVFASDGRAVAGANSGMTDGEGFRLRIAPPSQMGQGDAGEAFPLVVEEAEGLVVLRVFTPDETWAPLTESLLNSVVCRSERRAQ